MQIKVVEIKYILLWYIIWKKESKKRIKKVKEREREKEKKREREWEEELFFLFLGMSITEDGKPFYRLFKRLPLISSLMNINETHK